MDEIGSLQCPLAPPMSRFRSLVLHIDSPFAAKTVPEFFGVSATVAVYLQIKTWKWAHAKKRVASFA